MTNVDIATDICPFQLEISEAQVDDLRRRVEATRWPTEELVRADCRAHELSDLGQQTVTERLDDLVVGDLDPVGVLGADLVVAEPHRRGVGQSRAGEDESCGAGDDQAESVPCPSEDRETAFRDWSALSRDVQTRLVDEIRASEPSEHEIPLVFEIGTTDSLHEVREYIR